MSSISFGDVCARDAHSNVPLVDIVLGTHRDASALVPFVQGFNATYGGSLSDENARWRVIERMDCREEYFIAREHGVVVGYTQGREIKGTYSSSGLYVLPSHRRNGIGLALKQAQITRARELGCTIWVSSVMKDNHASVALQRKLGCTFEDHGDDYELLLHLKG